MKYCPYCGKEIEENKECDCLKEKETKKFVIPKEKIKPLAIIASAGVVALVVVIYLISLLTSSINLSDYIVVDRVSGLNTQGEIHYSLDEDALYAAIYGEDKDTEITEENFGKILNESFQENEEFEALLDCITLSATQETNLSNGDEVKITASFKNTGNHSFKYHIKKGKLVYKIEGLKDGKTFDPFADDALFVNFIGFNGKGTVEYGKSLNSDLLHYVNYEFSKENELSNGDEVVVTAKFSSGKLQELGYLKPEILEKTYTVKDLPEFLDSSSKISAKALSEFKKDAMEAAKNTMNTLKEDGYASVCEPEFTESFFISVNDFSKTHHDGWYGIDISNGILVMTHITAKGGLSGTIVNDYWYAYLFPDCYLADGDNIEYNEEQFTELRSIADTKEEAVQWLEEKFSDMTLTVLK